MRVSGSGDKKTLTVVTLGGAGFTWQDQCSPAAYAAIPDVEKAPFCQSLPGSRAPYKSTILGVYDYKGGAIQGSGAASGFAASIAAALGVAGAAVLLA